MKMIKHLVPLVSALLAMMLFNGCALNKDQVALGYTDQPNVSKVAGADNAVVNVTVTDARSDKTAVGAKVNGFGAEMAPIIAIGDVAALVQSAIETELTDRGFKLNPTNGAGIAVELATFRNHFKVGFWAGDAIAEVILNISVKNETGTLVYSNIVQGQGTNPNIQLATGSNAKVALDAALKDCMKKMFGDKAFIDALLHSSKPSSPPGSVSLGENSAAPQQ